MDSSKSTKRGSGEDMKPTEKEIMQNNLEMVIQRNNFRIVELKRELYILQQTQKVLKTGLQK